MKLIIICILLFSSVCSAKLTQVENDHLKKAIIENEISKFKDILKKADSPFKAGVLSSSTEEVMSGYELIKAASSNKDCRDEFVLALIQVGAKPYPDYFLGTTRHQSSFALKPLKHCCPFMTIKLRRILGHLLLKMLVSE